MTHSFLAKRNDLLFRKTQNCEWVLGLQDQTYGRRLTPGYVQLQKEKLNILTEHLLVMQRVSTSCLPPVPLYFCTASHTYYSKTLEQRGRNLLKVSEGILQKENTSEGVRGLCDRHAPFRFGFYCGVAQEPLMLSSSLSTSVAGNITVFTLLKATRVTRQPGGAEWPWSLLRIFPPWKFPAAHKVKERAPRPPTWTSYKGRLRKLWLTTRGLVLTFHEEGEKLSCESTLHHSAGKQGLSSSGQAACQTRETCWSWKVYSGLSFLCDYPVSFSSQWYCLARWCHSWCHSAW